MFPSDAADSDDFDALFEAGLVYLRYQDWWLATRSFERCVQLDPSTAPGWLNLAIGYLRLGRWSEARAAGQKSAELSPSSAAWFFLSEIFRNQGDLDAAVKAARRSIQLDPAEPIAHHYLAVAYQMQGKHEKALASLRKAIRFARRWSPALHVMAGSSLAALHRYDAALKEYDYVLSRADEPALETVGANQIGEAWRGKGIVHLTFALRGEKDHWSRARDAFEKATEVDPRDAQSWMGLGVSFRHSGHPDSSLTAIDRAIALSTRGAYLAVERGMALYELGEGGAAAEEFGFAIAEAGDDDKTRNDALTWLPYAFLRANQPNDCIEAATRSIRTGVDNAHVRNARAHAYTELKDFANARSDLEDALAQSPKDPVVLTNLANLSRIEGDLSTAMSLIEEAKAISPDHPDIWFAEFLILLDDTEDKSSAGRELIERAKVQFSGNQKVVDQLVARTSSAVHERNAFVAIEAVRERESSSQLASVGSGFNLDRLERRLDEFAELLDKPNVREEELKQFLKSEASRFLFGLDAVKTHTEHELGSEFRCDFVQEHLRSRYVLVELEAANVTLYTKGGKTAALTHGMQQVEDWQDWIDENSAYAQKKLPGCMSPEALVVIGRRSSLDRLAARRLERSNVTTRGRLTILTYDDLIDGARTVVNNLRASQ